MIKRKITIQERYKTNNMRRVELEHGECIEELIKEGSTRDVGARLGVSPGAISLWRARLGMRKAW